MTYREEIIREVAGYISSYSKDAANVVLELISSGKKCKMEQLKLDIEKEKIQAQKEVIYGYYSRLIIQKPSIEDVLDWLQDDKNYLDSESALGAANDIIMNYDPHEVSNVKCLLCNHIWVAVRPKGVEKLECPKCNKIADFENGEWVSFLKKKPVAPGVYKVMLPGGKETTYDYTGSEMSMICMSDFYEAWFEVSRPV